MNDLVLIQQDRPVVLVQNRSNITVLDSPDVVNLTQNAQIIVSNTDLPIIVKYATEKGQDGHTPTNDEVTDLITTEYLINKLTGQIKSTELFGDLASRIDRIGTIESDVWDLNNAVSLAVTTDSLAGIFADYSTTATADAAWATRRDGLLSSVGDNIALTLDEYTTTANLDGAIATHVETLIASTGNSLGDLSAALQIESQVRAQTIAPLWVDNKEYQKGESAMIGGLTDTYSGKIYQCITKLTDPPNIGLFPPDNASHWKLVEANLYAQYTLKTDVNGHIAGFGLANDGENADFIILADRFSIVDPDDPLEQAVPFIVTDGQVYINSALIADATITTAMITDGNITNAKIGNYIESSNFVIGTAGWRINKNGTFQFAQDANNKFSFDGGVFDFTGKVTFSSGSAGYAHLTDKPTSLADIDSTASTILANASANATAALNTLTDIASNNIITPGEKPAALLEYNTLANEVEGIAELASTYHITTENTAYGTAVSDLTTYISGLTGFGTIPGSNVVIDGTVFRSKFANVYSTRQTLLNAIADKAKGAVNMAANIWTRPTQTTIDGDKISTGDLGVDTLQIKGNAVTFPLESHDYTATNHDIFISGWEDLSHSINKLSIEFDMPIGKAYGVILNASFMINAGCMASSNGIELSNSYTVTAQFCRNGEIIGTPNAMLFQQTAVCTYPDIPPLEQLIGALTLYDSPGVGNWTYTLQFTYSNSRPGQYNYLDFIRASMVGLGTKR
jgi:hypothetical protein